MTDTVEGATTTHAEQDPPLQSHRQFPKGLSHSSLVQGDGYYIVGGPSPYEIEFQRPKQDLLRRKRNNETLLEALRRQPLTEDEFRYVALYGLTAATEHRQQLEHSAVHRSAVSGIVRSALHWATKRSSGPGASRTREVPTFQPAGDWEQSVSAPAKESSIQDSAGE